MKNVLGCTDISLIYKEKKFTKKPVRRIFGWMGMLVFGNPNDFGVAIYLTRSNCVRRQELAPLVRQMLVITLACRSSG